MKKLQLSLYCFIISLSVWSQSGAITGTLKDTSTKKALSLATVTVFKAKDTALVTYRLSTEEGVFKVPGLPLDIPLRFMVTYAGYLPYRQEFTLTAQKNTIDFGILSLQTSSKELDEVVVFSERPPVSIKRDTIEFNASAFKTLPTALVEDLLRKLPGVQVDRNGDIFVNGRKVSRLLVDGKSFFGDDPKMATRNLPANVIDKVQVVDDKDAIARSEDGDVSNIGKVINITLKKNAKKGVFGKVYAGNGTLGRNEVGAIANVYRDTLQLSLLGFSNNINRSGFSLKDVQTVGGFDRSGYSSMMTTQNGNRQGFALNNISFGGTDDGLNTTSGLGFNLNHAPNKKTAFNLQYFYGQSITDLNQTENKQQFVGDTNVNARTVSKIDKSNYNNTLNAGYLAKPDSLTDLDFKIGYSHGRFNQLRASTLKNESNKLGSLSIGTGNTFTHNINPWYHHDFSVVRRLKGKKGRSFNFFHGLGYRPNTSNVTTENNNQFEIPSPINILFNQLRAVENNNLVINSSLIYADPIFNNATLRLSVRHNYLKDEQIIATLGKDISGNYSVINPTLSSTFLRKQHRYSANAAFSYKIKKVTLTGGLGLLKQSIDNIFSNGALPVVQDLTNLVPNAMIQWKAFTLRYNMDVNAPSISSLNPLPDNSNPFFIRNGNPNLVPIHRHNISGWGYLNNPKDNSNIFFNIWGNLADRDVIDATQIDRSKGVVTTTPVNANGTINLGTSLGFNKEYKTNQKFIFTYGINLWGNVQRRKMILNGEEGRELSISFEPNLRFTFNWNDVVEYTPSISRGFRNASYANIEIAPIKINTVGTDHELIIRWPKKIVWESFIMYRYNSNVPSGLPKDNLLWNAGLTYLFLKDDKGQLKLSVFDVLNKNNQVLTYSFGNTRFDSQNNVLQQYFMLTFTYNIRKLGANKGKVGGRDKLFWF